MEVHLSQNRISCHTENGADESARAQWLMVERGPLKETCSKERL